VWAGGLSDKGGLSNFFGEKCKTSSLIRGNAYTRGAIKHSDGVTTFFSLDFCFFSYWIPPSYLSPPVFIVWDTGFDSFLRGKSGIVLGICCADDGRRPPHGRKIGWSIRRESCLINFFLSFSGKRYLRIVWIIARRCRVFVFLVRFFFFISFFLFFSLLFLYLPHMTVRCVWCCKRAC
jgi:hypothetical protein